MGAAYRLTPARSFGLARPASGSAPRERDRIGAIGAKRPRAVLETRARTEFNARRVYRPDSVHQVALADDHSSARIIAEPL